MLLVAGKLLCFPGQRRQPVSLDPLWLESSLFWLEASGSVLIRQSVPHSVFSRSTSMLERLLYRSRASHDFGSLHLFKLLTEARLRNEKLLVTGHLLYFNGCFTQCIEGPRESIDLLWSAVSTDPRHHDIELLARHEISVRRFAQWSMAFSTYSSLYVHGMEGFFPVDDDGQSPLVRTCLAD